jgi:hypothetical protein
MKFLKQTKNPLEYYLALGIISHGEEPAGLDFHTHKKNGYIDLKQKETTNILKKYRKQLGKINKNLTHNIIEFSVDHIIVKKNPSIIKKVKSAFFNPKIPITIAKFLEFLSVSRRKRKRINKYIMNKHLHKFFRNFQSLDGMADNWLNLKFFHNLKGGRHLPLTEKIRRLTKISYYNLKRKIRNKNIIKMFAETSSYLEKDCLKFLSKSRKNMDKLKNELIKKFKI